MLDERITAAISRFAVLGESLKHTWSPYIHNSLFRADHRDAVYLPITIPREKLASAVDVLRSCFDGFNVTIPYKEMIIPFLDEMDDAAAACGAVNTVEVRDGRMIGHITDGLGMISALQKGGIQTEGVCALILGGGCAARVAGYEFLRRGGDVTFAVRNLDKGKRLAQELSGALPDARGRVHACLLEGIAGGYDVLINCTPVGMYPNTDSTPVSESVVRSCKAVFDAVYNPRETLLLSMARKHGLVCVEGLGMLFDQAVEAQRFWFGSVASAEDQRAIYQELCNRL